jgi:hypothetical protein
MSPTSLRCRFLARAKEASTAALFTSDDKPMQLIEPVQKETVWVEGGGSQEK